MKAEIMNKVCYSALFLISPQDKYIVELFNGSICPGQYIATDSVEDAIEATRHTCFDFIVADVDLWTVEEVRELLENKDCSSIIVVATNDTIRAAIHAMRIGASNFILKEELSYGNIAKIVRSETAKKIVNKNLDNVRNKISKFENKLK